MLAYGGPRPRLVTPISLQSFALVPPYPGFRCVQTRGRVVIGQIFGAFVFITDAPVGVGSVLSRMRESAAITSSTGERWSTNTIANP